MSILLKALNQAAAAREATRLAQQTGQADRAREHADARIAGGQEPAGAMSANRVRISGPDAAASIIVRRAYGSVWMTLALAAVSAAGFGYWMRDISSAKPPSTPAESIQATAPGPLSLAAPGTIPAALRVHETAPLQLRLDRHVDTLGARAR